jgi:hypothetical protein
MEFRVRETGQVVTDGEFRSLHPNTSFPSVLTLDILDEFGVDPVLDGPQAATIPPYETSIRQGIEEINGQWFTKYVVGPIFENEDQEAEYKKSIDDRAAKSVREKRDKLLLETDWIVIKAQETNRDISVEFKSYRQALRDITKQEEFPHNVNWPTKPE